MLVRYTFVRDVAMDTGGERMGMREKAVLITSYSCIIFTHTYQYHSNKYSNAAFFFFSFSQMLLLSVKGI